MNELEEIMKATNPEELFGNNKKRARLHYMRLMKAVHPDNHSGEKEYVEAASKLTSLWNKYIGKDKTIKSPEGTIKPQEVTRNDTYVLFIDGGKWMLVDREVYNEKPFTRGLIDKIKDVRKKCISSPVGIAKQLDISGIKQPDGAHIMQHLDFNPFPLVANDVYFIDDLINNHIDYLEPEDAMWITKRLVFLNGILHTNGLSLNTYNSIIVSPSAHALILSNIIDIIGVDDVDDWLKDILSTMKSKMGNDQKSKTMKNFITGCTLGDDPSVVLRDADVLCNEKFGGIHFHEMKIK